MPQTIAHYNGTLIWHHVHSPKVGRHPFFWHLALPQSWSSPSSLAPAMAPAMAPCNGTQQRHHVHSPSWSSPPPTIAHNIIFHSKLQKWEGRSSSVLTDKLPCFPFPSVGALHTPRQLSQSSHPPECFFSPCQTGATATVCQLGRKMKNQKGCGVAGGFSHTLEPPSCHSEASGMKTGCYCVQLMFVPVHMFVAHITMAPCNGTTSTPPNLPPNHSTLQWHPTTAPSNGTTSSAPCNGTLVSSPSPPTIPPRQHPAMAPRPLHPAMAPWCHHPPPQP